MTLSEYKSIDLTFNESMFLTKVNNVFIKLYTAIMMDELEEVKHFINEDVLEYANSIVNKAKSVNGRQMFDELNVKESQIINVEVKQDVYEIKVYLQSRYMDYIIDLSNGNVISGNDQSRINVDYNLTFTKKISAQEQGITRKCPTCRAPLSVNTSGKCEYCGSIYNQEDYDWVLTNLEIC
jgi:predicted lipid-binding transport protein (Tim44 family)